MRIMHRIDTNTISYKDIIFVDVDSTLPEKMYTLQVYLFCDPNLDRGLLIVQIYIIHIKSKQQNYVLITS